MDKRLIATQIQTKKKTALNRRELNERETPSTYTFIESLSTKLEDEQRRNPDVLPYMKKFKTKKVKDELLNKCFELINEQAFRNGLPKSIKLKWNGRLTSTAGLCMTKISLGERTGEIHISAKVCDTPGSIMIQLKVSLLFIFNLFIKKTERMRDTLAHEMCHAAVFFINGIRDGGHGPQWKSWANSVNFTYEHLPRVKTTHDYQIKKKFTYKCSKCSYEYLI
jgi:predicted SprT family Zn-dependent metalloprotease